MNAKKAVAGRRSNQKQVEDSAQSQSKLERRSADAQLRTIMEKFAPTQLRLVGTVRRLLRKRLPTVHEIIYEYGDSFVISYSPNHHGYEGVFSIKGSENGVKLYFNRGRELSDPAKLLKGSGNQVRSIDIEAASTLKRPEVLQLIEVAIALNTVPFPSDGNGSVVIRPKNSK